MNNDFEKSTRGDEESYQKIVEFITLLKNEVSDQNTILFHILTARMTDEQKNTLCTTDIDDKSSVMFTFELMIEVLENYTEESFSIFLVEQKSCDGCTESCDGCTSEIDEQDEDEESEKNDE